MNRATPMLHDPDKRCSNLHLMDRLCPEPSTAWVPGGLAEFQQATEIRTDTETGAVTMLVSTPESDV